MSALLVLLSVVAVVTADPISYHDCPDSQGQTGHATSVTLSPCSSQPCAFKHGDNVTVDITFIAPNDSDVLTSKVYGIVLGIPVEFPLPNADGCKDSGIVCPIKQGQSYEYKSSFPVLPSYPQISLVVMWKIEGATQNDVCFTFPMAIDDSDTIVG